MPGPLSATMIRTTPLAGVVLRLDDDARRTPSAGPRLRAAERLDRVVDEIDDDAADLLDVERARAAAPARTAARCRMSRNSPL